MLLGAFALYFLILLTIGLVSHRKSRSEEDFILGNRSLNFWVTALSAHAADMSAWLFMALPAAVFVAGPSGGWMALGLFVGMFLNWHFVAPKLRAQTESSGSMTLSSFFEAKFSDERGRLRLFTALFQIFFLAIYLGAGLMAMGFLFESLFGMNYYLGTTFAIAVVVAYTFVGGFVAVAWTDLFQALFLLSVVLFVPILTWIGMGGGAAVERGALLQKISLDLFPDPSFAGIASIVFVALAWGLGYFGQPHIITKFMGIRDVSEMNKAKYVGMSWQTLALFGACFVGITGIGFFPEGLVNSELVFVEMVKELFPPFATGFILCAVLAANISTMDSQLLVSASVVAEDLYKRFFRKEASSKQVLFATRFSVVTIGLFALFVAFLRSSSVLDAVFYAWSGLGASFGPLVIASLYCKNVTSRAAITAMLIGGVTAIFWPLVQGMFTPFIVPAMIPGFFLALGYLFLSKRS